MLFLIPNLQEKHQEGSIDYWDTKLQEYIQSNSYLALQDIIYKLILSSAKHY